YTTIPGVGITTEGYTTQPGATTPAGDRRITTTPGPANKVPSITTTVGYTTIPCVRTTTGSATTPPVAATTSGEAIITTTPGPGTGVPSAEITVGYTTLPVVRITAEGATYPLVSVTPSGEASLTTPGPATEVPSVETSVGYTSVATFRTTKEGVTVVPPLETTTGSLIVRTTSGLVEIITPSGYGTAIPTTQRTVTVTPIYVELTTSEVFMLTTPEVSPLTTLQVSYGANVTTTEAPVEGNETAKTVRPHLASTIQPPTKPSIRCKTDTDCTNEEFCYLPTFCQMHSPDYMICRTVQHVPMCFCDNAADVNTPDCHKIA
ncbi:mucin-2-like, partial [Rhagoletis pomonella]|uniref:mucin-2-like n=1 Tax=Rhagoletis pomonella TaxID=28610 RepID=UPI001783DB4B